MTPLDTLINRLLDNEGGIADVGDGKGITRYGQTPEWLTQFNLEPPKNRVEAATNYVRWLNLVRLLPIVTIGDNLADILLDIAVMSSAPKAVKALQVALGIKVDGDPGPKTLAALAAADREHLAREVIAWDMEYQGRVITQDPTGRAQFAAGWAARMARHVRKL